MELCCGILQRKRHLSNQPSLQLSARFSSVTMRCKTRNCPLLINCVQNKMQNLVKQKFTVQFVVNVRKCIVNLNHECPTRKHTSTEIIGPVNLIHCWFEAYVGQHGVGIYFISKIQLVVYYQCCAVIGWATTRLEKRRLFGGKKGLKSSFN